MLSQGWTLSGAAWLAEPVGVSLSDLSSTSSCPLLDLDGLNGLHGLFARTNGSLTATYTSMIAMNSMSNGLEFFDGFEFFDSSSQRPLAPHGLEFTTASSDLSFDGFAGLLDLGSTVSQV